MLNECEKYSYSKISTYDQCKFKYKLKYFDKNFLYSANIATDFGNLIHTTEENIALSIQNKNKIDYISLKNNFILKSRALAHKYPKEFYALDKTGKNYLEKTYIYLDTAIYRLENYLKNNPNLIIIGIEQKFNFNYDENHSFSGSIDRAFLDQETGNILIQDIKSWPQPAQPKDLKAPLQFAIYMLAAKNLWNIELDKIKCEYDLPLCDVKQTATSTNLVEESKVLIDKLFAGIKDNKFKPTVSALCHWCEYNPLTNLQILDTAPNAVCPYFSTWQKSGDKVNNTLVTWQGLDFVDVDRQFCLSQLRQQRS